MSGAREPARGDGLSPSDAARLTVWWRAVDAARGGLPAELTPVLVRRLRAVGRGELPERGPVFVKVMAFPRWRDRLRYVLRSLPARHEARMLAAVAARGISCPVVVVARGRRRWLVPRLSMLVTEALAVVAGPAPEDAVAQATRALVAAGIFHPDLNPGNFARIGDEEVAVLDLQSARLRRPGLARAERVEMLGKLLAETDLGEGNRFAPEVSDAEHRAARTLAARLRRQGPVRRIRRCLQDSTQFERRLRWTGVLYRRRGVALSGEAGTWHRGGRELMRMWIGDRTREVLDGERPVFAALFRRWWWLPGQYTVYIVGRSRGAAPPSEVAALLEGFERFQLLRSGGGPRERVVGPGGLPST